MSDAPVIAPAPDTFLTVDAAEMYAVITLVADHSVRLYSLHASEFDALDEAERRNTDSVEGGFYVCPVSAWTREHPAGGRPCTDPDPEFIDAGVLVPAQKAD